MGDKIFVVNGYPESGKTTFENMVKDFCEESGIKVYVLSIIDYVKECAKEVCEWTGEKTDEARNMLSELKDLMTKYKDIPMRKLKEKINALRESIPNCVIFIDSREKEDIQKLVDEYDAKVIFITRGENNKTYGNHADTNVTDFKYDIVIDNIGDINDLKASAKAFANDHII